MLCTEKVCMLLFVLFRRNEELDDKAVIRRLKQKITELEKEVTALRTGTITEQQAHKVSETQHNLHITMCGLWSSLKSYFSDKYLPLYFLDLNHRQ